MGIAIGDERAGYVNEGEMVVCVSLPANTECAMVVVPAIGALDHPAARTTAHASNQWRLSASANVRCDAAAANFGFAVFVVVSLVETDVFRTARPTWRANRN